MRKLALILAVCAGPTWADDRETMMPFYVTGNDLYGWCGGDASWLESLCLGYILGAYDGMSNSHAAMLRAPLIRICVPFEATRKQLRDVVFRHLEENPSTRHHTAASRVRLSLTEAFPCD